MGPYKVSKRIGKAAYQLKLTNELAPIHPMFHVSMLNKCRGYPVSILLLKGVGVNEKIFYEYVPVEILDH